MKYKAELRIPTDQYAYINVQVGGEPDDIMQAYKEFSALVKPQEGLPPKEWRQALDEYLNTNSFSNADDTYFKMNPQQQYVIQEIKKSVKRVTASDTRRRESEIMEEETVDLTGMN